MALLDDSGGRRILIDVKHMRYRACTQYFNLLAGNIPQDIPADPALGAALRAFFRFAPGAAPPVISHAAVSGYGDKDNKVYRGAYPAQTAAGVMNPV